MTDRTMRQIADSLAEAEALEAEMQSAVMLRVLSLGAGVQSSVVALMSARGDLPPLDCAYFADTGWEPNESTTGSRG